jgi:hypothetical protein
MSQDVAFLQEAEVAEGHGTGQSIPSIGMPVVEGRLTQVGTVEAFVDRSGHYGG